MLTFFDYLRQRAFESIMAGAHEALELLEQKGSVDEAKANTARSPPVGRAETAPMDHASGNGLLEKDHDPLPAPRRRGRPREKGRRRR